MENTILEGIFLPWWKGLLYIIVLTLSIITVRFSIKFDLNEWLKIRRESKLLAQIYKRAGQCSHGWTLYPDSPFSRCVRCQAWIASSILTAALAYNAVKPIILSTHPGIVVSGQGEMVIVDNYIGAGS